jgi:hypothetical protein
MNPESERVTDAAAGRSASPAGLGSGELDAHDPLAVDHDAVPVVVAVDVAVHKPRPEPLSASIHVFAFLGIDFLGT